MSLAVQATVYGNANLHTIERIEVEHRRVAGAPSVTICCDCGAVFDMHEFSDHIAAVIWKVLSEAGIPAHWDAPEPVR